MKLVEAEVGQRSVNVQERVDMLGPVTLNNFDPTRVELQIYTNRIHLIQKATCL